MYVYEIYFSKGDIELTRKILYEPKKKAKLPKYYSNGVLRLVKLQTEGLHI